MLLCINPVQPVYTPLLILLCIKSTVYCPAHFILLHILSNILLKKWINEFTWILGEESGQSINGKAKQLELLEKVIWLHKLCYVIHYPQHNLFLSQPHCVCNCTLAIYPNSNFQKYDWTSCRKINDGEGMQSWCSSFIATFDFCRLYLGFKMTTMIMINPDSTSIFRLHLPDVLFWLWSDDWGRFLSDVKLTSQRRLSDVVQQMRCRWNHL